MVQTSREIHESFRGARIIHHSDRNLLVMHDFGRSEPKRMAKPIKDLAIQKNCSKLEILVPASQSSGYSLEGFVREARIGAYFRGKEDCLVMSLFLDEARSRPTPGQTRDAVLNRSLGQGSSCQTATAAIHPVLLPEGMEIALERDRKDMDAFLESHDMDCHVLAVEADAAAGLAQSVFHGFTIRKGGSVCACASIELLPSHRAALLANFLTREEFRGQGLARILIQSMEEFARSRELLTVYAVTLSSSLGMNLAYGHQHYRYGGSLVNHVLAPGGYEDANIWYRNIGRV